MATNPPPTGIVGNTPAQQQTINAGAAQAGTTSRQASMQQAAARYLTPALWLTFIVIGVVLANSGLSFAAKVIVAIALIYGGKQLSAAKAPFLQKGGWPTILSSTGWVVLITVLLFSGFGELGRYWANRAEASAQKSAAGTSCRSDVPHLTNGGLVEMRKGCPLKANYAVLKDGIGWDFGGDERLLKGVDVSEFFSPSFPEGNVRDEKRMVMVFTPNDAVFERAGVDVIMVRFTTKAYQDTLVSESKKVASIPLD